MASLDVSMPAAFSGSAFNERAHLSRHDIIQAKTMGPTDSAHYIKDGGIHSHFVKPSTAEDSRMVAGLSYETFIDVEARSPATPTWGKEVKFLIGDNNGHALLTRVEAFFQVGAIAQAGTSGAEDSTVYPKYLAERLLGDQVEVNLQQERVAKYKVDAMHFERMLMQNQSNGEREGYEAGVGIDETESAQEVWCELRLPYAEHRPMVAIANAVEHEVKFTIPTWASIRRYRGARASSNGGGTALTSTEPSITVFLRCHYTEVDKYTRAEYSALMLSRGLTYHVSTLETDNEDEFSTTGSVTAATVHERESAIGMIHPAGLTVGILRNKQDLENAVALGGTTALGSGAFSGITVANLFSGAANPCPDRFAAQPVVWWELLENKQRIFPRMTWKYFAAAIHQRKFPSEIFFPGAVVCHSSVPTLIDRHSLGHLTYAILNQPALKIGYRKVACFNEDGEVPELAVHSREREVTGALPAVADCSGTVTHSLLKFSVVPNLLPLGQGRAIVLQQ